MSLEDEFTDVVAKAMAGLELDERDLAERVGVKPSQINALLEGNMDVAILEKISPLLKLDLTALIGLADYLPRSFDLPGVRRIELPFGQWTVNAWIVECGGHRLLFDAGYGRSDIGAEISGLEIEAAFITHDHPDHTGGIAELERAGIPIIQVAGAKMNGEFVFGNILVRSVDLAGHMDPAVGYFIEGLNRQILVVGDAIFAGSIGRCQGNSSYRLAFETLNAAFSEVDEGCVILPGHGPATTLSEERISNPFRKQFHPKL